MGLCFCCLDEGEKVGRVLDKFNPVPVSQAQDGMLQKLVGRVVLAGTQPFYTPAKASPAVWYTIHVEEEHVHHRYDQETGQTHVDHSWHTIIKDEKFVDFYLQDGSSKLFVKGSDRSQCKIQGNADYGGHSTFFTVPPPGVAQLIAQRQMNSFMGWAQRQGTTGRYRYSERSFDVNEMVAALGVVQPAFPDPYTGAQIKSLVPFGKDTLTPEYFVQNKWEDWDIRSWNDLLENNSSVLLSDNTRFTGGVQVAPIQNLPAWMTMVQAVPQVAVAQPQVMMQPQVAMQPQMMQPQVAMQPQMMQPQMMQQQVAMQPQMMQPQMMQPQVAMQPQMMQPQMMQQQAGMQPQMMQPQMMQQQAGMQPQMMMQPQR